LKVKVALFLTICFFPAAALAQHPVYFGALGGLATLSGDGRAVVTPTSAATSLYDPQNGGAASLFWGVHFFEYISFQGNYLWNRNEVSLVSSLSSPGAFSFYQEPVSGTQNGLTGDVLIYFRKRENRIRPYLSEGIGAVHLRSRVTGSALTSGNLLEPPGPSSSNFLATRTSVGLDVRLQPGWYFRYTFGETISHNPISAQLSPAGQRLLKNFQNLFGIYRTF
jgi:hypothetical protein